MVRDAVLKRAGMKLSYTDSYVKNERNIELGARLM